MDDYGRRLCDPDQWAEVVSSFDLEPAEAVQAQGWRGVRVFTVDGYSRDMPAISLLAKAFDRFNLPVEARLEIRDRINRQSGEPSVETLSREAWWGMWDISRAAQSLMKDAPVAQSQTSTAVAAAELAESEERLVVCMHAWVTVTESLTDGGVTRRVRNACGDDPLFEVTYDASRQALRGFPHCNHLEPGNHRNESAQLQRCLALAGDDRIAAAQVLNVLDGPIFNKEDALLDYLDPDVVLDRAGASRVMGEVSVVAALDQILTEGEGANIYTSRVTGNHDAVEVEGQLFRYGGDWREHAALDQIWRKDEGGRWLIREITIGPMERRPD